ncbi:MAG: MarR family transcriptional regulator, partial [Peptococcales bacterium]
YKKAKLLELDKLVNQISKEFSLQYTAMLPDNITPTQYFLLNLINDRDCKAADIAEIFHISPAAASNMVERLYKNNWIERTRSEKDRRIVWLKLNKNGKELLEKVEKIRIEMQVERFKNINDEELDILLSILKKLLHDSGGKNN